MKEQGAKHGMPCCCQVRGVLLGAQLMRHLLQPETHSVAAVAGPRQLAILERLLTTHVIYVTNSVS